MTWEHGLGMCASLVVTWYAVLFAYRFARLMHRGR